MLINRICSHGFIFGFGLKGLKNKAEKEKMFTKYIYNVKSCLGVRNQCLLLS